MKKIQNLFSLLAGGCLGIVFLVTFAQVVQRYIFQLSMPWATDVIRIFFVYSVFFGMAVGVFKKIHLNIDVFIQILPSNLKPLFDILSNVVVLVFLCFVFRFSIPFMMANKDQYTPYLMFPMSYVYMIVPITVGFMVLFLLSDSVRLIFRLVKKEGHQPSSKGR
ncbi:MAG: TRAP-type transport system small permease protein [Petrotoga sp.]|nr:TRAP-type transport system small permease protein [Petrotoga sp.]